MNNRIIALFLSILMIGSALPFSSLVSFAEEIGEVESAVPVEDTVTIEEAEAVDPICPGSAKETISGKCGDDLKWTLDKSAGVLTISGIGRMYDYSGGFEPDENGYDYWVTNTPWWTCRDVIKTVIISSGVGSIGNYAFDDLFSLTQVTIPDTVTDIGEWAFYGCIGLEEITIPSGIDQIRYSAFNNCIALKNVVIPDGVAAIDDFAFSRCDSLESVTIPVSVSSIGTCAFDSCWNLKKVIYKGSIEQWEQVYVYDGNEQLTRALYKSGFVVGSIDESFSSPIEMNTIFDWSGETETDVSAHTGSASNIIELGSGVDSVSFIGDPEKTYENFGIVLNTDVREFKISFVDFNFRSNEENAISYSENRPYELTIDNAGNSSITSSYSGAAGGSIIGNAASPFYYVQFTGNGDLSITAGKGADGIGYGAPGQNGGVGIYAHLVVFPFEGSLTISGGDGGNGANGRNAPSVVVSDSEGGNGGNGSAAICGSAGDYEDGVWAIPDGARIMIRGGNGGKGGTGGQNKWKDDKPDWIGQRGGNGGNGGDPIDGTNAFNIYNNGGFNNVIVDLIGGNGGDGGNGGNGNVAVTYGLFGLGKETWNNHGGDGGDGGNSGKGTEYGWCGNGGNKGQWGDPSFNTNHINGSEPIDGKDGFGIKKRYTGTSGLGGEYLLFSGYDPSTGTVMGWHDARDFAESIGGHLATISSDAENTFIGNLISGTPYNETFLGGTDEEEEGTWKWVTGETFYRDKQALMYCNWDVNQPAKNSIERYLTMFVGNSKWENYGENASIYTSNSAHCLGFVVEKESGSCGENARWRFDHDTGILEITGTGDMYDYPDAASVPWRKLAEYINEVEITDGITSVGNYAFSGFTSLGYLNFGSGITKIGSCAFENCISLVSVNFYINSGYDVIKKYMTIGDNAFRGCTSLTEISIPDYVSAIGAHAFDGCSQLWGLFIPDSVKSIGESAFLGCTSLSNVVAQNLKAWCGISFADPDSNPIKYSHQFMYDSYSNSDYIGISDDVESIGKYTFYGCSMWSVNIPESVKTIGEKAFYECDDLNYVRMYCTKPVDSEGGDADLFSKTGISIEVYLNDENKEGWGGTGSFDGCNVTTIGVLDDNNICLGVYYKLFDPPMEYDPENDNSYTAVVSKISNDHGTDISDATGAVVIPDYLEKYDPYNWMGGIYTVVGFDRFAFYKSGVSSVSFGSYIGEKESAENPAVWDCTFREMKNLENIRVSDKNKKYQSINGALYGKGIDIAVTIDNEERILNCPTRLIKAPATVENFEVAGGTAVVNDYALSNNDYLNTVDLNDVQVIGSHAFWGSSNLISVTGRQLYYVDDSAFDGCTGLSDIVISGLLHIGKRAFYGAGISGEVVINPGIAEIGDMAFSRCRNITGFSLDNNESGHTVIDGVLFKDSVLMQYPLGNDRKSYIVPEGTTNIASEAFADADILTDIRLAESVKIVGDYAFAYADDLEKVYLGRDFWGRYDNELFSGEGLYNDSMFRESPSIRKVEVSIENERFINDRYGVVFSADKKILYYYPAGAESVEYKIPKQTDVIGNYSFADNTHIINVVILNPEFGDSRQCIGDRAFEKCSELRYIQFNRMFWENYDPGNYSILAYSVFPASNGPNGNNNEVTAYFLEGRDVPYRLRNINCAVTDALFEIQNTDIQTKDYVMVVRDTKGNALSDAEIKLNIIGYRSIKSYSDAYGRAVMSIPEGFLSSDDQSYMITANKDGYISYSQPFYLNDSMCTYITLSKEPIAIGVSCDENDINTSHFTLNKANYGESITYMVQNGEYVVARSSPETVEIEVAVLHDEGTSISSVNLIQKGVTVPGVKQTINYNNADSQTYVYTVPVENLIEDEVIRCRTEFRKNDTFNTYTKDFDLNIDVIDFSISEDDIDIQTGDLSVDLSSGDPTFATLFGSASFDVSLGKNVKFSTVIEGDTVTLTMSGKYEKSDSYNSCEEGFYANKGPGNTDTYVMRSFKTFKESYWTHDYRYVVRFATRSAQKGYYYYRCNIYEGNSVIHTFYGVVRSMTGRVGLVPKAELIAFSYNYTAQNHKDKNGNKSPDITKGEAYYEWADPDENGQDVQSKSSFSASLSGSLVLKLDENGHLRLNSGKIKGELTYTFDVSTQFVVWVIPVIAEIEVKLDGTVEISLKFDENNQISVEQAYLQLGIDLNASIGIGCRAASVGLTGNIGSIFIFDFYPIFGVRSWEMHGSLKAYYKILWHKKTFDIWNSGSISLIGSPPSSGAALLRESYFASDYVKENGNGSDENARLIYSGGELYKFGFEEVDGVMKLVYQRWGVRVPEITHSWIEPTVIDDNGLEDFSFDVYTDGSDIRVTYLQLRDGVDADSIDDYAEDLSLKYWESDGTVANVKNIGCYKYLETVTTVSGSPVVVWAENTENEVLGMPKEDGTGVSDNKANSIHSAKYENGVWIETVVCDGISTVSDIAVTSCGDIVFLLDTDGDISTHADKKAYIYNGSDVSLIDTGEGKSAVSVEVSGDTVDIVCVDDATGAAGLFRYNISDNTLNVTEFGSMPNSDNINILHDVNGDPEAVLYSANTESSSSIFALVKNDGYGEDEGAPAFFGPVRIASSENSNYISSFDAIFDPDDGNIIIEADMIDMNADHIGHERFSVPMEADLQAVSNDIDYVNSVVTVRVTNNGLKPSDAAGINIDPLETVELSYPFGRVENNTLVICEGLSVDFPELESADLIPSVKMISYEGKQTLAVSIKNNGNIDSGKCEIYAVRKYADKNDFNKPNAYKKTINNIDASDYKNIEINVSEIDKNDPSNSEISIISVYVKTVNDGVEKGNALNNNIDYYSTDIQKAVSEPDQVTVKWLNDDESEINSITVDKGVTVQPLSVIPEKAPYEEYVYTFVGWDTNGDGKADISENASLKANNSITLKAVFAEIVKYDKNVLLNGEKTEIGCDFVLSCGDTLEIKNNAVVKGDISIDGSSIIVIGSSAVCTSVITAEAGAKVYASVGSVFGSYENGHVYVYDGNEWIIADTDPDVSLQGATILRADDPLSLETQSLKFGMYLYDSSISQDIIGFGVIYIPAAATELSASEITLDTPLAAVAEYNGTPTFTEGSDHAVMTAALCGIPQKRYGAEIYARPYFVLRIGDSEVTVYGEGLTRTVLQVAESRNEG